MTQEKITVPGLPDGFAEMFLDDCVVRLNRMEPTLVKALANGPDAADCLAEIRRDTHNLRGMGGSYGFPIISLIAHRFEEFLAGDTALGTQDGAYARHFLDQIRRIVARRAEPSADEAAALLRALPFRRLTEVLGQPLRHVSVLLISERNLQRRIIEQELQSCGFQVTNVDSPFQAIEMGTRMRPDLIVASAVSAVLSGPELTRVFAAIDSTRGIPFVLATSLEPESPKLAGLPANVRIVHKGASFGADMAKALMAFGLLG